MTVSTSAYDAHKNALRRRRIKYVAEKGSIIMNFKAKTCSDLKNTLFDFSDPIIIASCDSIDDYDGWLENVIKQSIWEQFTRRSVEVDRWAYCAKLMNIVIYEIVSSRELFSERNWRRIQPWLHVPLDTKVLEYARTKGAQVLPRKTLSGMTESEYRADQHALRRRAHQLRIPPIWFEDGYQ